MIAITEQVAKKFRDILRENHLEPNTFIRVSLKAGGCSGFEVKIEVEENPPLKNDLTFDKSGVKFMIDKKSLIYLEGMEVSWSGGIMGGFKFNPPNATGGCGCGVSFAF